MSTFTNARNRATSTFKPAKKKAKQAAKKVLSPKQIKQLKAAAQWRRYFIPHNDQYMDLRAHFLAENKDVRRPEVQVGAILDEFSFDAWSPEFTLVPLMPTGWETKLEGLDLLLVESAWAGNDHAWQYKLTGSNAPSSELQAIVAACRERGIPTAFWNKEDPPHFHDFLDTARLFDHVFTTDSNMIPEYHRELGHTNVHVLPFAAQPRFHNPIRVNLAVKKRDVAFAGTYFRHKFESRRKQMDFLLGGAHELTEEKDVTFDIFSRHLGGDTKYQFPAPMSQHVVTSLPYGKMLDAYKHYKVFLNVNSVTSSPTMCARRIFEITAAGTCVVTTDSAAIPEFFEPNEIAVLREGEDAKKGIYALVHAEELRERMVHRAQRKIWEHHTYEQRAITLLNTVGINAHAELPKVSVLCSTNRKKNIEHLLEQFRQQTYPNKELLILTHGFGAQEIADVVAKSGVDDVRLISAPSEWHLGKCLNELVAQSQGELLAKFDDDDYYLPNYLKDQYFAWKYSEADLVGKASIFFYLEDEDALVRRWPGAERKFMHFVAGATLFGPRETFEQFPFAEVERGEDTQFIRKLQNAGKKIYSADRYNYIALRNHAPAESHTWQISDAEVLGYSNTETFGLNLKHVEV